MMIETLPPPLHLRLATLQDIPRIQAIAQEALFVAYTGIIPQAQIEFDLERDYSTEALTAQMEARGHRFLILLSGQEAMGFVSFSSHATLETRVYLHKLYLLPSLKGKGYGRHLVQAVMAAAQAEGFEGIELNVHRENPSVAFYRRLGFEIEREADQCIGQGFWRRDYVMLKSLG